MGVTKNYEAITAMLRTQETDFPKRISEIPKLWFIKSVAELEEYPKIKLLESPRSGPARSEYRSFLIAMAKDGKEQQTFLRLGSYCWDNGHRKLWNNMVTDVEKINPSARLDDHGGGVMYANFDEGEIKVVCNLGEFGAAEPKEVIELLKQGLQGPEYAGYKIIVRVSGTDGKTADII
jgi:hypothetical protein